MMKLNSFLLSVGFILGACQMPPEEIMAEPVTALVDLSNAETHSAVERQLAAALSRPKAKLGAVAQEPTSTVAVLPPAPHVLETRNVARPSVFDFMTMNSDCYAMGREDGQMHLLEGVPCRPE